MVGYGGKDGDATLWVGIDTIVQLVLQTSCRLWREAARFLTEG